MDELTEAGDGELWRRAGQGEADCFAVLFDRHSGKVRAYCARRTGSLDAAEDLVSIVFLEAWRRRGDVELLHDSALPWLYGVASHTVSHRLRTSIRHRRALARLPQVLTEPDHAEDVAARLDDQARLDAAHRALARLPRADQDVLVLCVWQELDYASAAIALGVPVGTVRSRLSRARARLRRVVEEPPPPSPPQPRAPGDTRVTPTVDLRAALPAGVATPAHPASSARPTPPDTAGRRRASATGDS